MDFFHHFRGLDKSLLSDDAETLRITQTKEGQQLATRSMRVVSLVRIAGFVLVWSEFLQSLWRKKSIPKKIQQGLLYCCTK